MLAVHVGAQATHDEHFKEEVEPGQVGKANHIEHDGTGIEGEDIGPLH